MVAPTSPNSLPISFLPLARPHLGKYTWASSANRSRMLPPVDVSPPLSNALRYSMATDLRCSSVIVSLVTVMADLLQGRGYHGGRSASTLTHTDLVSVYSCIASNPISRPYPELRMPPNGDPGFTRLY